VSEAKQMTNDEGMPDVAIGCIRVQKIFSTFSWGMEGS